jgi:hypothetical protein
MSLWTFQVGLNVTVNETWVDVTSRHRTDLVRKFSVVIIYNTNWDSNFMG